MSDTESRVGDATSPWGDSTDAPEPDRDAAPAATDADADVAPAPTGRADEVAPAELRRRRLERSTPTVPDTPTDATAVRAPKLTRRGRVSKWDRPPPPRDWRWYVGNVGKSLIAVGILMFGFVAYQLWGTGIENAASQRALSNEFEELLASVEPVTFEPVETEAADALDPADGGAGASVDAGTDADDTPADGRVDDVDSGEGVEPDADADEQPPTIVDETPAVVPVEEQNIPLVENGDAIARLEIPAIGADDIVVAGVETSDLKRGPGHFPDTPLPGQLGNAAIAGHRTTWGQPFHNVDKLEIGDELKVTTLNGEYVYRVTGQRIVQPSEYQVVATTDPTTSTLTLISCHPKWTSQQRIVIFSELDEEASAALGEPVINYGRPEEPVVLDELPVESGTDEVADGSTASQSADGDRADAVTGNGSTTGDLVDRPVAVTPEELTSPVVDAGIADAFSKGWFSDPAANPHVGFWGLVLSAIAILAYLISRRLRRDWVGLLVGIVPFVVTLYFFFQNVNRLLPPNL